MRILADIISMENPGRSLVTVTACVIWLRRFGASNWDRSEFGDSESNSAPVVNGAIQV